MYMEPLYEVTIDHQGALYPVMLVLHQKHFTFCQAVALTLAGFPTDLFICGGRPQYQHCLSRIDLKFWSRPLSLCLSLSLSLSRHKTTTLVSTILKGCINNIKSPPHTAHLLFGKPNHQNPKCQRFFGGQHHKTL